jgi:ribonuclease E
LPGKDTLQPLATLTGLVRSAASARAEVLSPGTAESGSGRRRRGGRGGRGGSDLAEAPTSADTSIDTPVAYEAPRAGGGASTEPAPRRFDHELVAVPMDADQELVFGWMGLNPALLLEEPPSGDNVVVRVVRPGMDAEEVLEDARQQLAASGSRRRRGRGGRGASGSAEGHASDAEAPMPAREVPAPVEITPLPEPGEPETVVTVSVPTTISIAPPEVELPARRGRTRSSAGSSGARTGAAKSAAKTTAEPTPAAVTPVALAEPDLDEAGEPRRRRRRSSASS